jgi:hypothetical protein
MAIIAGLVDADTSSAGDRNADRCAEAIDCEIDSSEAIVQVE